MHLRLPLFLVLLPVVLTAQSIPPSFDSRVYTGQLPPDYPTAYKPATSESITKSLERVHAYLEQASALGVVDRATGKKVDDLDRLPEEADLARTELLNLSYEWGVTYSGMLAAAEATGDERFSRYVDERLKTLARLAAHADEVRSKAVGKMVSPGSLDDSGAMCAAMIKAGERGLGGDLRPWIDRYLTFISKRQMRLDDGTFARNFPFRHTLWLDDLYMSVPALAQGGMLTGDRGYLDDAAKQILQFASRMFVEEEGLFMHGWVEGMESHPVFHWGRANGWAIMAMTELLSVMPEDHPDRAEVLSLYQAHARGLAAVQGHRGLWHQLLDRTESYEETSASAMFTFCLARGINRGWLDAKAYGPAVSLAWNAVSEKINDQGQVEGTCVGTGMGWDPMFYMYRPTHVLAAHGYGPVLLAGAEMIAFLEKYPAVAKAGEGLQFKDGD